MCEACLFCIYPAHSCVDCPFPEHRNTVVSSPSQQPLKGQSESVRTHSYALAELLVALSEDWWLNCCSGGWIRLRTDQLTSFSSNEKHINIIAGFFSRSPAALSDEMLSHEMQWRLLPENEWSMAQTSGRPYTLHIIYPGHGARDWAAVSTSRWFLINFWQWCSFTRFNIILYPVHYIFEFLVKMEVNSNGSLVFCHSKTELDSMLWPPQTR